MPKQVKNEAPASKLKDMGARKNRKKPERMERRIDLTYGVGRIDRMMKKMRLAERTGISGAVFMAATLEYMTMELVEMVTNEAKRSGRGRIKPCDLQRAICSDPEMLKLFANSQIHEGGYRSNEGRTRNIPEALFPDKKKKVKQGANED